MTENRQIVLKSRPVGLPTPENFALESAPMSVAGDGEMLVRTLWMSVDPYIRGRIRAESDHFAMYPAALK